MEITKKVKNSIAALAVVAMSVFGMVGLSGEVSALVCADGSAVEKLEDCPGLKDSEVVKNTDLSGTMQKGINVFLGVIGFIAVVMMIYGGFLYTTSAGDTAKVTKAKNAIMYGLIGLIVALLAFAIVNFVLTGLFNGK